jgi:hypothetical protein
MSQQTLADSALAFARAYREAKELPDLARRLTALAAQAGPADLDNLSAILTTLRQSPDFTDAAERGLDLENTHKNAGEHLGAAVRALAAAAHLRLNYLAAQAKAAPGTVAVADFGPGSVKVLELLDQPPASRFVVYGDVSRLKGDHPLAARLAGADLPTVEVNPVAYLGRPVTGLDGRLVPAPSYPLDQAIRWTLEAGRREKEQAEQEKWEQERRAQEAKETNRKAPTLEELNAQVQSLLAGLADLRAAGVKLSDEHRQEVARLSAQVDQLNAAAQAAGNAGGAV